MELLALRIIHVLSGSVWVGTAVFSTVLLAPALGLAGEAGGAVMAGLRERGLFWFMPSVAVLTVFSGARLMWLTSGGFSATYFDSARGATYAASGALAVSTFVLAMATGRRRNPRLSAVFTGLLLLSAAGMSVARYLG